jgi:adenylate cyclase
MIKAGVLFCDIREFTALSERLGAIGVVSVVNQIFEIIGQIIHTHGGEILKFIGDAVLIIFSDQCEERHQAMIESMINTVRDAIQGVEALGDQINLPLAIGFGGHVGDVLYGNIGTSTRLDFTVMGPAVNLASRLESLCKKFDVSAVFSSEIAHGDTALKPLGSEPLKGIADPVQIWGLTSESST